MSDFEAVAATEVHAATPGPAGEPAAPGQPEGIDKAGRPRSLAGDAWRDLRRSPIFWIASVIVLVMVLIALVPSAFALGGDPRSCELSRSLKGPSGGAIFGFDKQGCNVYARTIYGARASVQVGVFSTLLAGTLAVLVGMFAGYFGRWVDGLLSRFIDIVLGVPLLLGAIVLGKALATRDLGILPVVLALGLLGWTTAARIIRSSVISAKQQDYVQAARMLGAGNGRIMLRHILPNALAPMIVVLTIALGSFIAAEATLSFLGVGLKPPTISWGADIAEAQKWIRESAIPLLAPASFLTLTVLAFIMLGDAVREAFDPRLR